MTANRKFIEDVIELHKRGKSVEEIMFSLNMVYEEETDNEEQEQDEEREPSFDYNDLD